jgi:hypothetical protein
MEYRMNDIQEEYTEALNNSYKKTYDEAWSDYNVAVSKEKALDELFGVMWCEQYGI